MCGIALSVILWFTKGIENVEIFTFKQGIFFDFLLPPIIYNSGYNMRRKKFFQNLGNVAIFGLGVTFVCFAFYTIMTYLLIHYQLLDMVQYYDPADTGIIGYKKVELDFMPLMLFTSLLCSSDVVAAVSIVNYSDQPKLYSCIFGEGVINDIVSIILFNTVKGLQDS